MWIWYDLIILANASTVSYLKIGLTWLIVFLRFFLRVFFSLVIHKFGIPSKLNVFHAQVGWPVWPKNPPQTQDEGAWPRGKVIRKKVIRNPA